MIAALAALLLSAGPAAAAPADPCAPRGDARDADRTSACELLGAIDRRVPDGTWRALGPVADEVLAALARGGGLVVFRARALEALAARGGAEAEAAHRALAIDGAAPMMVRRAAVHGLSRLLDDAALTAALAPLAERDADGRVRAEASEVLARRVPAAACAGVRARASAGGVEAIRLERALRACGAAER
ncbi:MAG: hypothetical protein QM704_02565 [Anaeromyxobacteraceae bacterium]